MSIRRCRCTAAVCAVLLFALAPFGAQREDMPRTQKGVGVCAHVLWRDKVEAGRLLQRQQATQQQRQQNRLFFFNHTCFLVDAGVVSAARGCAPPPLAPPHPEWLLGKQRSASPACCHGMRSRLHAGASTAAVRARRPCCTRGERRWGRNKGEKVCACVRVCVCACVRVCVHECVHECVCL